MPKKNILLIENVANDFFSARLEYAFYLKRNGWQVFVLIPNEDYNYNFNPNCGIEVDTYELNRKDKSVFQLFKLVFIVRNYCKKNSIAFVHSFRFQPNIINVLSSYFTKHFSIIHITGLGIVYSINNLKYQLLRIFSNSIYAFLLFKANKVIFQNETDITDLWLTKKYEKKVRLILGSGVNMKKYIPNFHLVEKIKTQLSIPSSGIVFTIVSRLIWEKGITELISAFNHITKENRNIYLLIVGWSDTHNPRHVTLNYIKENSSNNIIFLGMRHDIPEILALSHYFIYPSYYREGIPRSILEALAMSKPVITTNMPGCNLTVKSHYNGLVIEPRSTMEIINSVAEILSLDYDFLANNSKKIFEEKFSSDIIYNQFEQSYIN